MGNIRKIQFRQQARGMDELPLVATCGRPMESECKNPTECKIHGPLLLEPTAEEFNQASAKARAIAQTVLTGFGRPPGYH